MKDQMHSTVYIGMELAPPKLVNYIRVYGMIQNVEYILRQHAVNQITAQTQRSQQLEQKDENAQ